MRIRQLIKKGNKCAENRESIPGAPLWHMGKVALFESENSLNLLQNTVDYLACKGKLGKPFTDDEKEFMKEIFEALWWGGQYRGFSEAAQLANHYVNGEGKPVKLDPEVYKNSVIVNDVMAAMKNYIRDNFPKNKRIMVMKSSSRNFLFSDYARKLRQGKRQVNKQGYLQYSGALLTEQSNSRLKNTDNRFLLDVITSKDGSIFLSKWKVDSYYDFADFPKGHVTHLPLAKGMVLKLPDGLSHYLTKIGVAQEFKYSAEWEEKWN